MEKVLPAFYKTGSEFPYNLIALNGKTHRGKSVFMSKKAGSIVLHKKLRLTTYQTEFISTLKKLTVSYDFIIISVTLRHFLR